MHDELRKARAVLSGGVTDGRDYYPDQGRMEKAIAQHDRRGKAIHAILKELEAECEGIQAQTK